MADEIEPPREWDLRAFGWRLCRGTGGCRAEFRHVLICDVRRVTFRPRAAIADTDWPAWRLIKLGVEQPTERARLLTSGCAEALPVTGAARELEARTAR